MFIHTLWGFLRRDLNIHTSYKLGFAMDLLGVFFSVATFYFMAKLFGAAAIPVLKNYGGDYFSFVLIGIAFSTYQNVGLNSFSQSIRQEQFLNTLEPLLMTPVTTPRILFGSALWDFLYATLKVALYLIIGILIFGLQIPNARIIPSFFLLLLTLLAFMGLGVFAAAFIMRFKRGNPVTWLVTALSDLLGGVFFPPDVLPVWLKAISPFIPMTHALSGLRKTLLMGSGWSDITSEILSLLLFILVLWPLGVFCFRLALVKAKDEGTLGHY